MAHVNCRNNFNYGDTLYYFICNMLSPTPYSYIYLFVLHLFYNCMRIYSFTIPFHHHLPVHTTLHFVSSRIMKLNIRLYILFNEFGKMKITKRVSSWVILFHVKTHTVCPRGLNFTYKLWAYGCEKFLQRKAPYI